MKEEEEEEEMKEEEEEEEEEEGEGEGEEEKEEEEEEGEEGEEEEEEIDSNEGTMYCTYIYRWVHGMWTSNYRNNERGVVVVNLRAAYFLTIGTQDTNTATENNREYRLKAQTKNACLTL